MRRLITLTVLMLTVAVIPAVAMANDSLSSGCLEANTNPDYDQEDEGSVLFDEFNAGEVLVIRAESGTANEVDLSDAILGELGRANVPGEIVWTVPDNDFYYLQWGVIPALTVVDWEVSCGADGVDPLPTPPPASDEDNDGVPDADDACPGTTLGDAPSDPMKNRHFANAQGQFVDGAGNDSGIDIFATAGCDEDQIIDALGLGQGHERFGLPKGAIQNWIAGL